MNFFASTHGAQGIAQTVRLPCKLIIVSIGHFKGQLKSNGTVGERLLASEQSQFDNAG